MGERDLPQFTLDSAPVQLDAPAIREQAEGHLHLRMPDDRELARLYRLATVFVFPSFQEGFGLPPLEAMACGTPVVAANSSSIPEVLGDAAILAPPEDMGAMSRAMLKLLTDETLAAEYIRRGKERAAMYRWDEIARRVMGVYMEVTE